MQPLLLWLGLLTTTACGCACPKAPCDPETGLYYYRARYYSPKLGRFLQTDPIGTKDDLNLYAYVCSDPVNATDPTGEWYQLVGATISVAAYYATTDNPTLAGAAVAGVSGALGGGAIKAIAQLGKIGFTLAAGKSTLTTMISGMPVALPMAQTAGAVGQVAGAIAGGAVVGGVTHVGTNMADAAATGQLNEMTHPLAGVDTAMLAGAVAGPLEMSGVAGASATSGKVAGTLSRVGAAMSSAAKPAARAATSEAAQQGAQRSAERAKCPGETPDCR